MLCPKSKFPIANCPPDFPNSICHNHHLGPLWCRPNTPKSPHPPTPLLLLPELRPHWSLPGHALSAQVSVQDALISSLCLCKLHSPAPGAALLKPGLGGRYFSVLSACVALGSTWVEHLPHSVKIAHVYVLPTRLWVPLGQEPDLKEST